MKIKTKEKTVRQFTLKLSEEELRRIHIELYDIMDDCGIGFSRGLNELYEALRAEVHQLT